MANRLSVLHDNEQKIIMKPVESVVSSSANIVTTVPSGCTEDGDPTHNLQSDAGQKNAPDILVHGHPESAEVGYKQRRHRVRAEPVRSIPVVVAVTNDGVDSDSELGAGADHLYYLAMVNASPQSSLRPLMLGRGEGALFPIKPQSRVQCEQRCGADGFCDPSSFLGCGGEHCGRSFLDL